jgi:aminopeptidase N
MIMVVLGLLNFINGKGYFQQYVNYEIDAFLNIQTHTINGFQKLLYVNNSPDSLSEIYFHLYFNKFEKGAYSEKGDLRSVSEAFIDIYEIKENGEQPRSYDIFKTLMHVALIDTLAPGDTVVFNFDFGARIPYASSRYGYLADHYSVGNWYPTPVVYDKNGWHLHQHLDNEFYQEWGDFKVSINVPKGFIVGATGNLVNADIALQDTSSEVYDWYLTNFGETDTTTTWKFEAENVHDFAWAADPEFRYIRKHWNGIDINFLVMRPNYNDWIKETKAGVEGVRFLSEQFGPYPYKQITIVDTYIDAGGMEYPNIVFINTNLGPASDLTYFRAVVIHELAHNWFYGLLASNQTEYEWMDEGFTQFAEILAVENIFGTENNYYRPAYDWFSKLFPTKRDVRSWSHLQVLRLAKSTREEDAVNTMPDRFGYGVGSSQYDKMAKILFMLENVLGTDVFWLGMRNYVKEWSMKHPQPDDFKSCMEKAAGTDLDWFFNQWLNTVKHLDLSVASLKNIKSDDEYVVQFEIENKGGIHMPFDVLLVLENGDSLFYHVPVDYFFPRVEGRSYLPEWHFSQKTYKQDLLMDFKAAEIMIDPQNALTDVNKLNNSSRYIPKMDWHFMTPQTHAAPVDKYIWETWPGIFYNNIDKFKIGLANYGSYIGSDHLFDIKVWYKTYTANVDFSVQYRTPIRWLNRTGIFSNVYTLDGRQGADIELRTRYNSAALFSLKVENYTLFNDSYLAYPWQRGTFNTINLGANYAQSADKVYSAAVLNLKNALQGSEQPFGTARLDLKQSYYSKYSDYVLDVNISTGLGSNETPLQEQFNLAGGNGIMEFGQAYYRARGSLPYSWRKKGHLVMHSNAKVRGATLYKVASPAVLNNNIIVSSIEFDFPNLFYLMNISLLDFFENSLFYDSGVVWSRGTPPSYRQYLKSAGISLMYNNFYSLSYIFGIDNIKLDFPLWVGESFNEDGFDFRWIISFDFDFSTNLFYQ